MHVGLCMSHAVKYILVYKCMHKAPFSLARPSNTGAHGELKTRLEVYKLASTTPGAA